MLALIQMHVKMHSDKLTAYPVSVLAGHHHFGQPALSAMSFLRTPARPPRIEAVAAACGSGLTLSASAAAHKKARLTVSWSCRLHP